MERHSGLITFCFLLYHYQLTGARAISPSLQRCNDTCHVSRHTDTLIYDAECRDISRVPGECNMVEKLDITNSVIHHIDNTTFRNFTNLQTLLMVNNGINSISDHSFVETKLVTIDLSHNEIVTLTEAAFQPLANLKSLDLDHNKIREVQFQNLQKLEILRISNNEIDGVTYMSLNGTTKLTYLDLSQNKITRLVNDCLGNLSKLRELVLSDNEISSINRNAFHFLTSLVKLNLSSNLMAGNFSGETLKQQRQLTELDLSGNRLTGLLLTQQLKATLHKLRLKDNLISFLPKNTFRLLQSIGEIDLEGNDIGYGSTAAFLALLEDRPEVTFKLGGNPICEEYRSEFSHWYGTSIHCLPQQTEEYQQLGKPPVTTGMVQTPRPIASGGKEQSNVLVIVLAVSAAVLGMLILMVMVVRLRPNISRMNRSFTSNPGYNVPHRPRPHHEHLQIPTWDPPPPVVQRPLPSIEQPPPPVPPRDTSTIDSGPYMNTTIDSMSTQSYIQPNPPTPKRGGTCSHDHKQSCQNHRPPRPAKHRSSPNLRMTPETSGSLVIVGTNHCGTGKATMSGLPRLKNQWRRSLTKRLPGHYLTRRETKEGKPIGSEDREEVSYMTRHETIDGRPTTDTMGTDTMGTATYKTVHD